MKDFIKGYYFTVEWKGVMYGTHCGLFESLSLASYYLKFKSPAGKVIRMKTINYHTKETIYLFENNEIKT